MTSTKKATLSQSPARLSKPKPDMNYYSFSVAGTIGTLQTGLRYHDKGKRTYHYHQSDNKNKPFQLTPVKAIVLDRTSITTELINQSSEKQQNPYQQKIKFSKLLEQLETKLNPSTLHPQQQPQQKLRSITHNQSNSDNNNNNNNINNNEIINNYSQQFQTQQLNQNNNQKQIVERIRSMTENHENGNQFSKNIERNKNCSQQQQQQDNNVIDKKTYTTTYEKFYKNHWSNNTNNQYGNYNVQYNNNNSNIFTQRYSQQQNEILLSNRQSLSQQLQDNKIPFYQPNKYSSLNEELLSEQKKFRPDFIIKSNQSFKKSHILTNKKWHPLLRSRKSYI